MLKPGLGVRESVADLALGHISVDSTMLRLLKSGFKSLFIWMRFYGLRSDINATQTPHNWKKTDCQTLKLRRLN